MYFKSKEGQILDALVKEISKNPNMLPLESDYVELAETLISKVNPGYDPDSLTERAQLLVQLALTELQDLEYDIDMMNGAPLPVEERMDKRLHHENPEIRKLFEEEVADWIEEEEDTVYPLSFRAYYQRKQAYIISLVPNEVFRFVMVAELFYPEENIEEWNFIGSDNDLLMRVEDENGDRVDPEVIGYIFSELYIPLMDLANRMTVAMDFVEESVEDLNALEEIDTVEDLFGES